MKLISIVLAVLVLVQPLALARNVTTFEGGKNETVASLSEPLCSDHVNIILPVACHVRKATMNISSFLPEDGGGDYPGNVTVMLNNTILWIFNGSDYGAFGKQDSFANNTESWETSFGREGGTNDTAIRLPKRAVVQNATVNIGCAGWNMTPAVDFYKNIADDYYGCSVSGAGDVNGDGYDDAIVGMGDIDTTSQNTGAAYIFYGEAILNGEPNVTINGTIITDYLGISVSSAGDVDGDGFDDVIVGSRTRAYIFHGGTDIDDSYDLLMNGEKSTDSFGYSVSGAGDLNNDGYDDVIVGAGQNDAAGTDAGRAYVYYGGTNMDSAADVVLTGENPGDYFGISVSGSGDVNGDGFDDVIVGASCSDAGGFNSGRVYIYYGKTRMDSIADVVITAESEARYLGSSVSGAGDVNNDGYDDVVVGAPYYNGSLGAAYVYLGGTSMDSTPDTVFTGGESYENLGSSVSAAGDVNNDGYDDIVIGSKGNATNGTQAGMAFVLFGNQNPDSTQTINFTCGKTNDGFGWSVSDAGDYNGDGFADMMIGTFTNKAFFYIPMVGLLDPSATVGAAKVWNGTGYINSTCKSSNFAPIVNDLLRASSSSGSDMYGNLYVDIPIQVEAKSGGAISMGNLNIIYSCTMTTLEFSDELNEYISSHRMEKDASGNLIIPIEIHSASPGRLKLTNLNITIDEPPRLLEPIPDVGMDEETMISDLLDLWQYFGDDYYPSSQLKYGLISVTNDTCVRVELLANRYISVDMSDLPQSRNWTGEVEVVINCTDIWGLVARSNPFTITVWNVPDPPVISSIPPREAVAGLNYSYNVTAIDGDKDPLEYGFTKGPMNMTIDDGTGALSWVPAAGGSYDVTVFVTDGLFIVFQNYSISVPNQAPRIINGTIPVAYTGVPFSYDISAVDDDGDILSFSILGSNEGMIIDGSTGRISWTPIKPGDYLVQVNISDGTLAIVHVFSITVVQTNRAPAFKTKPPENCTSGLPLIYNAHAMDPDGDPLFYSLIGAPDGMVLDNATGRMSWTPFIVGEYEVLMRVEDGRGGKAFQEFAISVLDPVKARVLFIAPSDGQTVKGRVAISGRCINGTFGVVKVQVRVDKESWKDADGNSNWQYVLNTSELGNGRHTIQARALVSSGYSETASLNLMVDNATGDGIEMIPLIGMAAVILTIFAGTVLFWKKKRF